MPNREPEARRERPARLADVAESSGVSVATVSRALSGHPGVSDELRRRIEREAERIGYVRDATGHSLRSGKTSLVGVWVESIQNASSARLVSALTDALHPHGYDILVTEFSHDPAEDESRIQSLAKRRPDYMIVLHPPRQQAFADFHQNGHQVILISSGPPGEWDGPLVFVNSSHSRRELAHDLIRLGHERVLVLQPARRAGRPGTGMLRRVVESDRLPLEVEALFLADSTVPASGGVGLDEVIDRLLQPDPPTCIQVNEAMAAPLLGKLRDANLRIPEDISVVSSGPDAPAQLHGCRLLPVRARSGGDPAQPARWWRRRTPDGLRPVRSARVREESGRQPRKGKQGVLTRVFEVCVVKRLPALAQIGVVPPA